MEKEKSSSDLPNNKKITTKTGLAIIIGAVIIFFLLIIVAFKGYPGSENAGKMMKDSYNPAAQYGDLVANINPIPKDKITKFDNEQDFKEYLEKSGNATYSGFLGLGRGGMVAQEKTVSALSANSSPGTTARDMAASLPSQNQGGVPPVAAPQPERSSETNVQVLNIDEPDIVKTNGEQIYFSQLQPFTRPMFKGRGVVPMAEPAIGIVPPDYPYPYPYPEETGKTRIIKAFPPSELKTISEIDKNGDLLAYKGILIVFAENKHKILGYDVSQPEEPKEKWTVEIQDENELVGARLYQDKVYLVTRSFVKSDHPCPIEPFLVAGRPIKLECNQIYHPGQSIPVDSTYNILSFNAETGEVKEKTSFVGSSSDSILYMSGQAIYLTYNYPGDFVRIFSDFLGLNSDLIPSSIVEKVKKLENYDLSDTAKNAELEDIIGRFTRSMNNDEVMRIQNELTNRIDKFAKERGRELENTGIVKIGIPSLDILATGKVTGKPLNQFSLDEYQNNLRIATTYSGNFGWIGGIVRGGQNNGASDVYVLNANLDELGAVLDLGKGEKIYSVRFLEDKGYVVTFKQVDPFFVLDLSSPKNPAMKGQLKIPGYSSYLHPIDKNTILGVGQEDGQVKLTLFDVESPSNPKELNTYKLDEYWSEVSSNHHSFLLDKKHDIFFIPGGKGGYVFSYKNNVLALAKALSEPGVKRAVYINDYLYILADSKIVVLNEDSWEKIKELEL